jgi:lysozyme
MKLTRDTLLEIASHEALVRSAYKDSVGVWTWSIGVTNHTGHRVERYIDNPASLERCLEVWLWALQSYVDDVEKAFEGYDLTEEQFAAALSFHYNTGGIFRASWVNAYKAGDLRDAKARFMLWNKPSEIIPRRKKECDLFFSGKWSHDGTIKEVKRLSKSYQPIYSSMRPVEVDHILRKLLK